MLIKEWIGLVLGLLFGFAFSVLAIFPSHILSIRLADITLGNILRVLFGVGLIPVFGLIGIYVFVFLFNLLSWIIKAIYSVFKLIINLLDKLVERIKPGSDFPNIKHL